MKEKYSNTILTLALVLLPGSALADASVQTVDIGPQIPTAVCPGADATNVVTVTRLGGGNQEAFLSVTNLPIGATAAFAENPLKFSGNTSSLTTTMWISTTADTPMGSHPFTLTARVGVGNFKTNTGQLDVTPCSPGIIPRPDGSAFIVLIGVAGRTYNVQATTNLLNAFWVTLCTTNCAVNNLLVFVDHDRTNYPTRFYRLAP